MKESSVKITFAGNPLTLLGNEIKVGDKAPDFVAVGAGLTTVKLSDYAGKAIIVSAYPSIDTGVCAAQNRRFNAEANKMKEVVVLSISCDLPFAQSRFCAAEGLENIKTISDHKDLDFGQKYGFWIKELRLLARGTVVIDKSGIVRYVEYVSEVTHEPNYEAALAVVKKL
ncbi:MAG: thiol peroxidase [Bacteroidetes bacterium]|nr:thiol peroxidase [Bacteroidota bacterium]MCL6102954.1 thiol peroxidase [Bacteroidota bacterium]